MNTEIIKIDHHKIDIPGLTYAADVLKQGGLVAFPTETVYGLGANALNEIAVKNIFIAKGRPSDNPLIVHIANHTALHRVVSGVSPVAALLMEKLWPGPLTLVMDKSEAVPFSITAGLPTVAVRMPSHPIALQLIALSGLPIAAPSANLSGKSSPTSAEHVIADLMGKVDVIIDGGNCNVGLESTVLDITVDPAMILRPGGVTPAQLESVIGKVTFDPALSHGKKEAATPKSPGMKYTHYSPKARLILVEGTIEAVASKIKVLKEDYEKEGLNVGILATEETKSLYSSKELISMGSRSTPETIAASLFLSFREFDKRNVQVILAEGIDASGIGLAVMNRMIKAAGNHIVKV